MNPTETFGKMVFDHMVKRFGEKDTYSEDEITLSMRDVYRKVGLAPPSYRNPKVLAQAMRMRKKVFEKRSLAQEQQSSPVEPPFEASYSVPQAQTPAPNTPSAS